MSIIEWLLNLKQHRVSSTPKVCRTRMVNEQFFVCRVKKPNPKYCEYSLSMGDGYLCRHDERSVFADT